MIVLRVKNMINKVRTDPLLDKGWNVNKYTIYQMTKKNVPLKALFLFVSLFNNI